MCEWYALCDREAVGYVWHPILGDVPCCQRCADKHGLTLTTGSANASLDRAIRDAGI